LRRLQDKAQDSTNDDIGIGLLLVGMGRLKENLLGSSGQYKQLYSRIQATVALKPVNDKGLERIVSATLEELLVTITDDAMRSMIEKVKGNVRTLEKLLKASVQTCLNNQSTEIDADMVEAASETIIL
jgi:DNA transposition AAA+ family ATPase